MNNNIDMNSLLKMLSNMDKKDLEQGIAKANQILKSNNQQDIINQINNKNMGR